ncbi:hypothetical protein RRG08_029326 [Elysia crispata]|uniref:Uncharacterized protein n=1 Tax=Elysia crispata TaxID=231223 RepID=A0AAE1E4P7_9GAST|nr:hypothetical protein RRG08_029326 [Elysia crispata]
MNDMKTETRVGPAEGRSKWSTPEKREVLGPWSGPGVRVCDCDWELKGRGLASGQWLSITWVHRTTARQEDTRDDTSGIWSDGIGWLEDWGDGQRREKGEGEKERSGMVGDPKVSRLYALNEWEFAERR